jgi:hypothetical protein
VVSASMQVMDVRNGNPRRYVPKFSDYVSIQWEIVDMSVPRPASKAA